MKNEGRGRYLRILSRTVMRTGIGRNISIRSVNILLTPMVEVNIRLCQTLGSVTYRQCTTG